VAIFARGINDNLTSLVKKLDAETGKNKKARMGSFVIFLNDDEKFEKKLKDLGDKEKIKQTVLALVEDDAGPRGWNINKDADITVILYTGRTVKANYAFKKGEMKAKDVDSIIKDVAKILPKKEEKKDDKKDDKKEGK
jgi:hypothetical protein